MSSESSNYLIDWRPSHALCAGLVCLGWLAALSLWLSALPLPAKAPLALLALGYGLALARRESNRLPFSVRIATDEAGALLIQAQGRQPLACASHPGSRSPGQRFRSRRQRACPADPVVAGHAASRFASRTAPGFRQSNRRNRAGTCDNGWLNRKRMSMFQPLSFAIGLRYLRAKRRNGFISFISMASILGILIGVMALITTISVMNGFQDELRDAHPRHGVPRHHRWTGWPVGELAAGGRPEPEGFARARRRPVRRDRGPAAGRTTAGRPDPRRAAGAGAQGLRPRRAR